VLIFPKTRIEREKKRRKEIGFKEKAVTGRSQPSCRPPVLVSAFTRGGSPEYPSSTVDGGRFDAATAEPEFSADDGSGDVSHRVRRRRSQSATTTTTITIGGTEHGADVLDQRWHVVATGSVPHVVDRCSDVTLPLPLAPTTPSPTNL
jgi:hypothetical protein